MTPTGARDARVAHRPGDVVRYTVDPQAVGDESRMVALQTAVTVLRLVEAYQQVFGPDLDRLMILLAVGAITAERPLKAVGSPDHYARFGEPIPSDDMVRCSALSIAAATGLPRETARRKVARLIDDGLLWRDAQVGMRLNEDILHGAAFQALVPRQAGEIARLSNVLLERGVLAES